MVVAAGGQGAQLPVVAAQAKPLVGRGDRTDAVEGHAELPGQRADFGAVGGGGGEQQLVVVAAGGAGAEGEGGVTAGGLQRGERQGLFADHGADRGLFEDVAEVAQEAVGDVEHAAGEAAQAEDTPLPRLPWVDEPGWAHGGGLYHIACDYRLMIDNLMDLTHETYVHSTSIGQKEIDEVPCKTRVEGDEVITSRFMEGIEAPRSGRWRCA